LCDQANAKGVVSLIMDNGNGSEWSFSLINSATGNVRIMDNLQALAGDNIISTQFNAAQKMYSASVNNNGSYSMLYIELPDLIIKTLNVNGTILNHDFHMVANKSVLLMGDDNSTTASFYEVDFSGFSGETAYLFNITAPEGHYFSVGAPMAIDQDGRIFIAVKNDTGSMTIVSYALKTGLYLKTISSDLIDTCNTLSAREHDLYCINANHLIHVDLKSALVEEVASNWCNGYGISFSQNSAFDWNGQQVFSFFYECGDSAAVFQISLNDGSVKSVNNNDLEGVFGPHVGL